MIISEEQDAREPIKIYLKGPAGNAFALMSLAENIGKQLGFSRNKIQEIKEEMKSGDYENLINTLDTVFGDYIILVR